MFPHKAIYIHEYRDVDHHYNESSPVNYIHNISIPTLALSAADDPVCSIDGLPKDFNSLSDNLIVCKARNGGHVAYAEGYFLSKSASNGSMRTHKIYNDLRFIYPATY